MPIRVGLPKSRRVVLFSQSLVLILKLCISVHSLLYYFYLSSIG
nr:MAG TPA: hypothetical protein [Bacteriophage sp.]